MKYQNKSHYHCPIQAVCQGCLYINESYEEALLKKHAVELSCLAEFVDLKATKVVLPVYSPKQLNYRTSVKLPVSTKSQALFPDSPHDIAIGLYQPNTHKVVAMTSCAVQHPAINQCLRELTAVIPQCGITAYDETTAQGDLRYVQIRVNRFTQDLLLTLVVT